MNIKTTNLNIKQLKNDIYKEIMIHQNIGTKDMKPCNRGSCHLNIVFHEASLKQMNNKECK